MSKSFKTEEFPMSENLKVTALSKNNNKKKPVKILKISPYQQLNTLFENLFMRGIHLISQMQIV